MYAALCMHTCAEWKTFFGKDDQTIIILGVGKEEGKFDPSCITHFKVGKRLMNEKKNDGFKNEDEPSPCTHP